MAERRGVSLNDESAEHVRGCAVEASQDEGGVQAVAVADGETGKGPPTTIVIAAKAGGQATLTASEKKAFRMGVLAAGAIYIDAIRCERCRGRVENLRIAIAARSVECEAPEFWPLRGGE